MAERKPNVLFIPADDLRPQLACYGQEHMITPNIDRLADRGTLFARPYCQAPVCGATRASLLTGVRPTRERFVDFKTWVDRDLPGALTLPEHFRRHGYVTLSVGKVFHHRSDTSERSWSEPPWHPLKDSPEASWRDYQLEANRTLDGASDHRGPPFECADVPDDAYFDGRIADRAIDDLRRLAAADEPFLLAAGFIKPHLPFNAPRKYWDYYKSGDIRLADNPFAPDAAPERAIHNFGELRAYFDVPAEGPVSDDMAHRLVHGYYAATSYADAQVGRLLDELDRLGLGDNTIVVLWGDHGWQLGEHGLWCKHCNFNTSLWAPLIVSAPQVDGGRRCNELVEFVDVYPTLCDLAGLPLPDHLQGASFAPLLDDPARSWKQAVFSRYGAGESIRTDRYLYTEWTDDGGAITARMLYDHQRDPAENRNISERPDAADLVADLSRTLRSGWQGDAVWRAL